MNSTLASAGILYQPVNPITNVQALHNNPINTPAASIGFIDSSGEDELDPGFGCAMHIRTARSICEAAEIVRPRRGIQL
jgi:hypothetical protein